MSGTLYIPSYLPPPKQSVRKRKQINNNSSNVNALSKLTLQELGRLKKAYNALQKLVNPKKKTKRESMNDVTMIQQKLKLAEKTLENMKKSFNLRNNLTTRKLQNAIEKAQSSKRQKVEEIEEKKQEKKRQKQMGENQRKQKIKQEIESLKMKYIPLQNMSANNIYNGIGRGRPLVRVTNRMIKSYADTVNTQAKAELQSRTFEARKGTETLQSIIGETITPEIIQLLIKLKSLSMEQGIHLPNPLNRIRRTFSHEVKNTETIQMNQQQREMYYLLSEIKSQNKQKLDFKTYLRSIQGIIELFGRKNVTKELQTMIQSLETALAKKGNIYYIVVTNVKYSPDIAINKNSIGLPGETEDDVFSKLTRLKNYTHDKKGIRKDIVLNLSWGNQLDHDPISVSSFVPFLQNLNLRDSGVIHPNSIFYYLLHRSILQNKCMACPVNAKACRGVCDLVLPRSAITVPDGINGKLLEIYKAYGALVHGILSYDKVKNGRLNRSLGISSELLNTEEKLLKYITKSQENGFRKELIKHHNMRYGCYVFDDNGKKRWLRLDMNDMSSFFSKEVPKNLTLWNWETKQNSILNVVRNTEKTFKQLCIEGLGLQ